MCRGKLGCCWFLALFLSLVWNVSTCVAEEIEPKLWSHLPVGINFIGTGYAYTTADITFDPVLKIVDGKAETHSWVARFVRSFSLFDKLARVEVTQGYQEGRWTGQIDGTFASVTRTGWADTLLRFAVNLYGSPPLKGKDFVVYRTSKKSETIVGAGLVVQLPTGKYLKDKLINLGTNRYTFRPQVGVVSTWKNWTVEATGSVAFYTDNNEFLVDSKREQDPLYLVHGHVSYNFTPAVWASMSLGYDCGGESTVDGENKDDHRQDLAWSLTLGFPVSRRISLKAAYVANRTQENVGSDADSFLLSASTQW